MSARAGTIQGAQAGVSWAGGWIAAVLLTVVLAVTLFAMTRGTNPTDAGPANARLEVTQQLGDDGHVAGVPARTNPARQPITIGSYACHQCR